MTNRRRVLALTGALAATPGLAQLPPGIAELRRVALEEAVRRVVGSATPHAGRVKLDLPPLIDNGNSVPIPVSVESPMTPTDHVKAIHVLTEKNPQPNVLEARLGPRAGRAGSPRARASPTRGA